MWNHIRFIRRIKRRIPFGIKMIFIYILYQTQNILYSILKRKKICSTSKKKIYVLLSTDYPNLGDHAMTYAQVNFLKKKFEEYEIIEITVNDTLKYLDYIKSVIKAGDIITLKGGGNIGVEYFREELIRRKIVKYFPENKIVIFPQTVYFPNTKFGKKEFLNTIRIYKEHKYLYLFLRDKKSYDMIKTRLDHIYLCPDIVWSIGNLNIEEKKTCDVLICMRNDVEGIYTEKEKENLKLIVCGICNKIEVEDTIKPYYIGPKERYMELMKIWKKISSSRIVITDRLHGLIFSAILGVPCIVLGTYNHKLEGQYEWVKDNEYITYLETYSYQLPDIIKDMLLLKKATYSCDRWDDYFRKIEEVIRG